MSLHAKVLENDLEGVKKLVADGADVDDADECLQTPLHLAAQAGCVSIVRYLMGETSANREARDIAGRSPLNVAAGEGHDTLVTLLADMGCDLESESKSGNTPILRAAAYGHAKVVSTCIARSANIDKQNKAGLTPLMRSSRWGHAAVVAALVSAGAKEGLKDEAGGTAATWASRKGHVSCGRLIGAGVGAEAESAPVSKGVGAPLAEESSVDSDSTELPPAPAVTAAPARPEPEAKDDISERSMSSDSVSSRLSARRSSSKRKITLVGTAARKFVVDVKSMEGYMSKQGHIIKNWKVRWFRLDGLGINYYKKQGDTKPAGAISLAPGSKVSAVPDKDKDVYAFEVQTPGKDFILRATDEKNREAWIEAIRHNLEILS